MTKEELISSYPYLFRSDTVQEPSEEIAQKQAQTQLEQAQAEQMKNVVQTPYGPMSQALAAKVFPASQILDELIPGSAVGKSL